ncbi:MAG: M20 peptidase family dipeptidase [Betaproteobacteria bacterium]|nr:MAG: M20 peptidase family dipeptidase [Betaproteobacteria bacterium]
MTRESAVSKATAYYDDGRLIDDIRRRVAIPSESQVLSSRAHLTEYLREEIAPALASMGFRSELLDNPVEGGGPILFAERIEDERLPTMLTYGHGDVIRGLQEQWRSGLDPWTLVNEGDRYYGRGSADNKGQHSINMAALASVLETRGRLGFNVKVLMETSEELGSPGLRAFCERECERLRADVFIASDGPRLNANRPTLFLGSRGALNVTLKVHFRDGANHSGNWGGLLANPGIVLAHAIASIVSREGKVLARGILPPPISASVRTALADCPVEPIEGEPSVDDWWGEPGFSRAEKVFGWNTFEVLAFRTGNPDNPVNAIPGHAVAHCQIRFVAGTDPEALVPALRRHLDEHGFPMVALELSRKSFSAATRLDPDNPWVRWAARSIERSLGVRPAVLPNLGGTLPNECFADVLGLPTLWFPHSYAGCSQHAPDEHVLGSILREGMQIMAGIFWDLGEADTPGQAVGDRP